MDEHLKLSVWLLLILGCLLFINSYFGFYSLMIFLVMLSSFAISMIFIFHGNFLSFGMIAQVMFSIFILIFAGIVLYYFLGAAPSIDANSMMN